MKTGNFTKGKWVYEVTRKNKIVVKIPNNTTLQFGTIYSDDCGNTHCCKREEHSNARLVAHSPDLLKACQSFINDFEVDFVVNGEIVDNPSLLLISNYKILKEVVMLAIGE